jgi:DNA-binding transcriptional MocR family regulator
VLVESPVYHLALKVFRDHQLTLVPVAADAEGMQPAALAEALERVRAAGGLPRFIYTVPTFGNPSASLMPAARRREIVSLARSAGTLILEDDVYRHLWFDAPPPPPLQLYGPPGAVVRFGSFSKLLAPGLRLGWLLAAPEIVERCKDSGLLDSGGGLSHLVAHMAGEFIHMGLLDPQVTRLRASYRARCMALLEGLAAEMPAGVTWARPGGGFFTWLTLPDGLESAAMQPAAAEEGVAYIPESHFVAAAG